MSSRPARTVASGMTSSTRSTAALRKHVDADTVAWTTGFKVPELAREAGLAVDDRGRMLVDATLRSESHPEVYGIGDAAAARNQDGQVLRMGCGPGELAAVCAFHAITDRLAWRTPKPLRVKDDGLLISLGRRDALFQPTDLDGSPRGKVRPGARPRCSRRPSSAPPGGTARATPPWPWPAPPGARDAPAQPRAPAIGRNVISRR